MNETKHTKGPWVIPPVDSIEYTRSDNPAGLEIVSYGVKTPVRTICSVRHRLNGETEANARLIAAAPELLEELQALVKCFWDGRPKKDVRRDYHLMVEVEAARKAIAKATGRAL